MKVIIIDDEYKARNAVKSILAKYCPHINLVAEGIDVKSGIEAIKKHQPDLILLDIQMPDGTGFDLLDQLDKIDFSVVFITAYEEYAIKAFEFSALHYLLKPPDPEKLVQVINQIWNKRRNDNLRFQVNAAAEIFRNDSKKIVLKTAENVYLIALDDIIRCQADVHYTNFYFKDGTHLLISKTLKDFETLLSNYGFFRTHKGHLVNIRYIKKMERKRIGSLILTDGSKIPVAVRKKEMLVQLLEKSFSVS